MVSDVGFMVSATERYLTNTGILFFTTLYELYRYLVFININIKFSSIAHLFKRNKVDQSALQLV